MTKIALDNMEVNGQHVYNMTIFHEIKSHNSGTTDVKLYTDSQTTIVNEVWSEAVKAK